MRTSPLIDGFLFAESGGMRQGVWPIASFARLRDRLNSTAGGLDYVVSGLADEAGRPALQVQLSGLLQLTCQRCLGPLQYPLQIDAVLVLARSEAEVEVQPVDPGSPDRVLGGKEMDLGTLLEDEVLLAVPFAPHHETCSGAGEERKGQSRDSPFADLRGLLKPGGRAPN